VIKIPQSINPNQQTATTTGYLATSANRGRYQVGHEADSPDITSGQRCAMFLGGRWIEGRIEYGLCYVNEHTDKMLRSGYFFIDLMGNACGVCMGMLVRLYREVEGDASEQPS